MKLNTLSAFTLALVFAATPLLSAQDLKTRGVIASSKTEVAEHTTATNKKCGTSIAFNVDYSTFSDVLTAPENANQQSPWAFIVNVTDALDVVCGTPEGKAAVQAKIKTVTVKHAKAESEALSGTTFAYAVPYTGANVQTIVTYLQSKL